MFTITLINMSISSLATCSTWKQNNVGPFLPKRLAQVHTHFKPYDMLRQQDSKACEAQVQSIRDNQAKKNSLVLSK